MKSIRILWVLLLLPALGSAQGILKSNERITAKTGQLAANISFNYSEHSRYTAANLQKIKANLHYLAPDLNQPVIEKIISTLECSQQLNVPHNQILTVIDYSLPANKKRFWVFNLRTNQLLFHTYVAHGIKSGALITQYFSNRYNSKASSMGVYKTEQSYYGREGIALRLAGLEPGFNANAQNRAIVMHGGWYMDEQFIKKYGRSGRSWGCPAIPLELIKPVVETIKNNSLMIMYYPDDRWFLTSKLLNCSLDSQRSTAALVIAQPLIEDKATREAVVFADLNKNAKRDERDPIIAIAAEQYFNAFNQAPPLERMLRRQINKQEYIALSATEFKHLISNNTASMPENNKSMPLDAVVLITAEVKNDRGYYKTEMKILPLGKLKQAAVIHADDKESSFNATFEHKAEISLRSTTNFIRWLGL